MEETQQIQDAKVREASHIYLLMRDDYRVSRNTRASWYFTHLHTNVTYNPNNIQEDSEEELQIISIVLKPSLQEDEEKKDKENERREARISPSTGITFLAKRYRLVFVLDISPSVTSVDLSSSEVLLDEMINGLRTTLKTIIRPFHIAGSQILLSPELYVTVIAHSPLIHCRTNQVLLQCCLINPSNLSTVLQQLSHRLEEFENEVVKYMGDLLDLDTEDDSDEDQKMTGGIFDDIVESELPTGSPDPTEHLMTPEASFINMLRYGMLALHLLQENSAAAIVVLTDGIVGVPDAALFESLMSQLRHNTIACSFIQVGNCYHVQAGLGQVAYSELLQFMANATFGSYFAQVPKMCDDVSSEMNSIQHALLTWSFQRALTGVRVNSCSLHDPEFAELTEDLAWTPRVQNFGENKHLWVTPLMKKKHTECNLHTGISHLISCRLREGYTIKYVAITKGESQIEVLLVLPWRDNVWIHYRAVSAWPINSSNRNTHVEMTIEGSYDFLHDATCTTKKPFKSPYRTAVVKKYWQAVQGMLETDSLLVHLQSFTSNPLYFNIPDSVKNGVPLFYLPPDSNTPNVNKQHSSKESLLSSFATFWKPVLMLDVNIWQKWMHTHRVSILLEHDKPLGKHLHIPNSSGRFHSIACRQAQTALNVFLSDVSTFVLMENHSYVSLIFSENDKPPTSFYVLRVAPKPPCLVLRLAFLGGTPGQQRNKVVAELQTGIQNLKFPQRGTSAQKDDKTKKAVSQAQPSGGSTEHKPPLQRLWSETPCCIITAKPIEKLLIRYERMPSDFLTLSTPLQYDRSGQLLSVSTANRLASSVFTTLSRYLYHRRWVWSVQHGSSMPISMQAIGRILATITKIRLQEGFHFAHANSGIVNLVLEVDMKNPDVSEAAESDRPPPDGSTRTQGEDTYPCVMQYLVFPPHTTTTKESMSDEDVDEMETTEADGELQIITEIWVEPQYGICTNSTPERHHFDSRDYKELGVATLETDTECISTMITFEHLNLMCQSISIASPTIQCGTPTRSFSHLDMKPQKSSLQDSGIQRVPFAFDLMCFLPKCQQAELLFSSYIQDLSKLSAPKFHCETLTAEGLEGVPVASLDLARVQPNTLLFNSFLEKLTNLHDCEVHLKDEECAQLLLLIVKRDRDRGENPLPFVLDNLPLDEDLPGEEMEECASTVSVTTETSSTASQLGAPLRKRARTLSMKKVLSFQGGKSRTVSCGPSLLDVHGQQGPVATSSPQRQTEEADNEVGKSTTDTADVSSSAQDQANNLVCDIVTPRWRCFVKSITATHIMLSFVPATFDDLRILTQGQGIVRGSEVNDDMEPPTNQAETSDVEGFERIIHIQQEIEGIKQIQAGFHVQNVEPSVDSEAGETETLITNVHELPTPEDTLIAEVDTKVSENKEEKVESVLKEEEVKDPEEDDTETVKDTVSDTNVIHAQPDCPPHAPDLQSLTIPVYVYNCPLSSLTEQLVNRWTHQPQMDVYQDLTTQLDCSENPPKEDSLKEDFEMQRPRTESENMRERWRQCMEDGQDAVFGSNNADFKQHCTLISEHYFRSFVTGVFQSLQFDHEITTQDVDTAINGICEESVPIEMDITRYLHSMCGHVRQLIERAKIEQMMRDDNAKMVPKSLETKDEVPSVDTSVEEEGHGVPVVLPLSPPPPHRGLIGSPEPVLPMRFPLAILSGDRNCEALSGLHNLVRKKFTEIVTHSFKPIPSNPDFFFYCPPNFQDSQCENLVDIMEQKKGSADVGNESEIFVSDMEENEKDEKASDRDSLVSIKDDDSSTLSSIMDNDVDDIFQEDDDVPPLFVHFTCSVRTQSNTLKSIPVRNLPTCLRELKACLAEVTGEIDLNDVQVTLDVICLTLPLDTDLDVPTTRPCYNRMTSYNSQVSYTSNSPPGSENRDESFSFATSVDGFMTKAVTDSLRILPSYQLNAVNACKDQVLWLLRDEIASALRMTVPVTAPTLEMVANHVKDSEKKPCCIFKTILLQFVYGPEQSLMHFIESFEKINLPGYHLNKERGYYYLFMDRARADTIAHAQAISCALQDLDNYPLTAYEPEANEVLHASQSEPSLHRTEQRQPLHLEWTDGKSGARQPEEAVHPSQRRKESVVVLSQDGDEKKVEEEDSDRTEDTQGKEGAMFRAEDIKISVIRPSPVKEAPSSILASFTSSGEKEKDISETTSGSSIQILDDRDLVTEEAPDAEGQPQHKMKGSSQKGERDGVTFNDTVDLVSEKDYDEEPVSAAELVKDPGEAVKEAGLTVSRDVTSQPPDTLTSRPEPSTVPGQTLNTVLLSDKSGLKRVRSSASFEKYKNTKKANRAQTPTRSSPQTPSRSRHQSGPQTPLSGSVFDTSSRSSVGEEGYEAGYSDSDDEGIMLSFNESMVRYPQLPNFWLIMGIEPDRVNVFFHTRDTGETTEAFKDQKDLFDHIIRIITHICCTVNQKLLLQDLYDTRMCNWLLVPEADVDVQWGHHDDKRHSYNTKRRPEGDSDDSDTETVQDRYLEAALHVRPGYFACECVWKTEFVLHPRLKTGPRRIGMSQGMQALQVVLQRFSVNNRKNMFVIKESSGAVFYLRLEETVNEMRPLSQSVGESSPGVRCDEDFSLSVSRSSSVMSLPTKVKVTDTEEDSGISSIHRTYTDAGRRLSAADASKDDDSVTSSMNLKQRKTEAGILVSVHGIGQVGPEISVELVNMLQRKLDDAVLEILVCLFVRNPMCKLLPEDVHFIQPSFSAPKETVRLTIPPSALLQQFPLGYYLWQNLLQFFHTPKYADPRAENMFRDYSQASTPPIPENFVFLCSKRPQHAGGKGIACIQQSFVDGRGNSIQLFSSPKPSPYAYKDKLDVSMFESMVSTSLYNVTPRSRSPGTQAIFSVTRSSAAVDPSQSRDDGPTALVQFDIWQRGDVDTVKLTENLVLAMKHAVCDIIMEYRLLTAPLCDVPQHYTRGMDSPMHSAPPSPIIHGIASDPRSVSVSPVEGGKKPTSESGGRTPREKSFNLQSFLYDTFKTKSGSRDSPKDSPGGVTSQTWQEIESQRRQEADFRQKIHKYETGERGTLQPVFCSTMIDWLEFCSSLNVPSVQKLNCTLMSRSAVEYVLREFHLVVNSITSDMQPKIFKLSQGCGSSSGLAEQSSVYLPYAPARSAHLHSQDSHRSDSSLDLTTFNQGYVPGRSCSFIGIGRNVKQWRASIDYVDVDEDMVADFNQLHNPKTHKSLQRFLPLESSDRQSGEKHEMTCLVPFDRSDKAFVPRQRFLLMTIRDKKVALYTYNWVQDLHNSLAEKFNRLVCLQNARSHLLNCILSQKAGLFHHTLYSKLPPNPNTGEPNIFAACTDVQLLVKCTSPPIQQGQIRSRTSSIVQKSRLHPAVPVLHEVYRDAKPPTPMHRSSYAFRRDPLHRHGAQMLELKRIERKDQEKHDILVNLYKNWQQRMGPSHAPIPEEDLLLLKTSSRLIHSVATPLLFNPGWRKKVLNKQAPFRQDSRNSDTSKPRSRHSSGASMRSKRSDSMDSKKRVDSPDVSAAKANMEALWHIELRNSFISHYIQYLQGVTFVQIHTWSSSPKRGSRHLSGELCKLGPGEEAARSSVKPNYQYLQKTLPGGIMLLELGFKDVNFFVHVYAYECSRLPFKSINPQLAMIFTDECEKFKDVTHVHSFAHGFHLRTVQSYITGREPILKQHYHLTGFLQDFIEHYPYAPSFSRNYVFEGTRNLVLNTNSEAHQLFLYMLEHDKLYGMRAIRMDPVCDEDSDPENEYVLVKQFSPLPDDDAQTLKARPEDYDVGLVIMHDTTGSRATDTDRTMLRLKYYILLTSKKDLFPKHTMEKRLGIFKSSSAKQFPATGLLPASAADTGDGEYGYHSDQEHPTKGKKNLSLFEPPATPPDKEAGEKSELPPPPLPMAQYIGLPQETTNYLGYSNKQQAAVYHMLLRQAHYAREKIQEMVSSAMSQCRRDLLWQRMLLPSSVTEEEGRRKRRSEQDEAKDPFLTRLSFTEFQELMSIVKRVSLQEIDPRLLTLENMNMPWYQALVRVLRNKYAESHRYFASPDGLIQYVVVLNPNFLDMFMMLAVDSLSNKTELTAGHRERMLDQSHTPTNPNLPAFAMQTHVESFVNTCFYHMWSKLL